MKIRQNGAAVQLEDKKMTTLIPVRIKWHGGRKKIIPAATLPDQKPEHDASMLVALSRAYHWQRLLDAGVVDSGSDIARRGGLAPDDGERAAAPHAAVANAGAGHSQRAPAENVEYALVENE